MESVMTERWEAFRILLATVRSPPAAIIRAISFHKGKAMKVEKTML
jgi:hypothetical protein